MFKVKDKNGNWLQSWRRFAGNKYNFIRLAEDFTKSFVDIEVWVVFQRTILDDPSILWVGNKEVFGDAPGTVKVLEPCWFLCRSLVGDFPYFTRSRGYFDHYNGPDWRMNNLVNTGHDFENVLEHIDLVDDDEPFAVLQLKKIGPEKRFLLTIVKNFRKEHLDQLGIDLEDTDDDSDDEDDDESHDHRKNLDFRVRIIKS